VVSFTIKLIMSVARSVIGFHSAWQNKKEKIAVQSKAASVPRSEATSLLLSYFDDTEQCQCQGSRSMILGKFSALLRRVNTDAHFLLTECLITRRNHTLQPFTAILRNMQS